MADSHDTQTLPTPQSAIERRRFLTMAGGLAAATAAAGVVAVQAAKADQHPDAELIRLGKEFRRAWDGWSATVLVRAHMDDSEKTPALRAADQGEAEAFAALDEVADAIRVLAPSTAAGFFVRLLVLCHDFNAEMPWSRYADDDEPLMALTRQMERLAAQEAAS